MMNVVILSIVMLSVVVPMYHLIMPYKMFQSTGLQGWLRCQIVERSESTLILLQSGLETASCSGKEDPGEAPGVSLKKNFFVVTVSSRNKIS